MKSILPFPLLVAAALGLSASLHAAVLQFNVTLDGIQSGTGSPGTGSATAVLDTDTGGMTITGSFAGMNGTSTNAHLHGLTAAPVTGNAGVLFGLSFDSGVTAGNFSGAGTLSPAEVAGAINGQTYINIHSSTNGGGEIRGWLTDPVPEPSSALLLLGGLATLGLRRRRR